MEKTSVTAATATPENPLIVELDREKWRRGKGSYESKLLAGDGRMCCMGFAALAFGATPDQIMGLDTWGSCPVEALAARDTRVGNGGRRFAPAYEANDDQSYGCDLEDDRRRVWKINGVLTRMGENFRFALKGDGGPAHE